MLALLLCAALSGDVYTVDDDGPADFHDIQAAVDVVPAGSTLLVEVGAYAGFTLTKRLTILGHEGVPEPFVGPEPWVGGVTLVEGASTFTLAGLRLSTLVVRGVPGRGVVDDCTVVGSMEVSDCAQLVASRLVVLDPPQQVAGLSVDASALALVDADLVGGMGLSLFAGSGGKGAPALHVTGGSHVVVAGSRLVGGPAGQATTDGPAGDGLVCEGSLVLVRGSASDLVDDGSFDPAFGGTPGRSIACTDGTVLHGGVPVPAGVLVAGSGLVEVVTPPEPYLELTGSDGPGEVRSLDAYGPPGAMLWLLVATGPGPYPLARLEAPLWLDPGSLLLLQPVVTLGQDAPLSLSAALPASLAGLEGLVLHVQAVAPGLPSALVPGTQVVTNVAPLVVRF